MLCYGLVLWNFLSKQNCAPIMINKYFLLGMKFLFDFEGLPFEVMQIWQRRAQLYRSFLCILSWRNCSKCFFFLTYTPRTTLSELMETNMEDRKSMDTYSRELHAKTYEHNLNKQSVCLAKEQDQTRGEELLEKEVRSENAKTGNYDENYNATNNELFPSQSRNCPCRVTVSRNVTNEQRNGSPRRTPFRELNCNNKQEKSKQTIWRPWWTDDELSATICLKWL